MADQLSGIAIIICIAFGVLTFILLFIFAKRQITRFALKSRRGPHVSVGIDAPKRLCQEIERRLERVNKINYEPCLLKEEEENLFQNLNSFPQSSSAHLFRMKVMHDIKALDIYICSFDASKMRRPGDDVHKYYLQLHKAGFLVNLSLPILYQFLEVYEHSRHEPQDFSLAEYTRFCELLRRVKNSISISPNRRTNPVTAHLKEHQPEESTKWYVDDCPGVLLRNNGSSRNESTKEKQKLSFETSV